MQSSITIETTVLLIVAAALHASWNALLKRGNDPFTNVALMQVGWVVWGTIMAIILPTPTQEMFCYIGISVCMHIAYLVFLILSFKAGNMSIAYTIGRAVPLVLVAIINCIFLEEDLEIIGWIGIFCVSSGIFFFRSNKSDMNKKLVIYSITSAISVALYTVIDGAGIKISNSHTAYTVWIGLVQGSVFLTFSMFKYREELVKSIKKDWYIGLFTGAMSIITYNIVLYSMTIAPVSYVATIREISILFACIIGILFLKEKFSYSKLIAAIFVILGIGLINFS